MGKKIVANTHTVKQYLEDLTHPLKDLVLELRLQILDTNPNISEHIKWNSPAYYYSGKMKPFDPKEYKRDLVVINLHSKDYIILVFPSGAMIDDPSGLLEGDYPDGRKIAKIYTLAEVNERKTDLQNAILSWLSQIEK
jgi:hypothetical protein